MDRRRFLWAAGAGSLLWTPWAAKADETQKIASRMEPWSKGLLDVHHISTGRGNSVLAICPDGTSIMIDAGAAGGATDAMGPARPDDSRRPSEWIARYAQRQLAATPRQELDYFVLTHLHDDHMGAVTPTSPLAKNGAYRLTGVTDVAEAVPIRCLLDRGYPDYRYPAPFTDEAALNYIRFARYAKERGVSVERFKAGSRDQIVLQHELMRRLSRRLRCGTWHRTARPGRGRATRC